ncbi:type I-E CRISPR-associated protein Cse2/CasB [Streptomyces sparsogenes]|uniref:type I-E CRISPR-associated protein Cse2/CasB n=1 Tax=Streptomyces sparsogenes TaxID=67365 RepID=UPI003324FA32
MTTNTGSSLPETGAAGPRSQHRQFTEKITQLCDDKRVQADLRSGLGLPYTRCNRMHRHLVRFTSETMHPDARQARYTVASLIAARPRTARDADATAAAGRARDGEELDSSPRVEAQGSTAVAGTQSRFNLGASLAATVCRQGLKPDSAEGELHLLTRQSTDAFLPRLPSLIRLVLSTGAPVDWAVLLEDLEWWNHDRDRIATRWLDSYYRTLHAHEKKADIPPARTES